MKELIENLGAATRGELSSKVLEALDPDLAERQGKILSSRLAEVGKQHGPCVGVELASVDPEEPDQQTWFLVLGDRHRSVVSLCRREGRVTRVDLPGEIPPADAFTVEEIPVAMADGAQLRTFVFRRPGNDQPRPVVLSRTPYTHHHAQFRYDFHYSIADRFLELGYVYVVQSLRGTHGSEGIFQLMHPYEVDDGYDSVTWATAQPFCSGRVAATGISYSGFTAVAAGVRRPAGLEVIIAASYPTNLTDYFSVNGVLKLHSNLSMLRYMLTGRDVAFMPGFGQRCKKVLLREPDLTRYDQLMFGIDIPEWKALASAYPDPDAPLWQERQITDRLQEIDTPGYHFAGLGKRRNAVRSAETVDGNLPDVVRAFREIDRGPHRQSHRLYLGAWGHHGLAKDPACRLRMDQILAHHLDDAPLEWKSEPRILVASCHEPRQLGGDDLSLPGEHGHREHLYFRREGDRFELAPTPGSPESRSSYDMLPTELIRSPGPQLLEFEMTCEERLLLLGPLTFELYLEIDVPEVDLLINLTQETPDGRNIMHQCNAFTRVRRHGTVTRVRFETEPVSAAFEPGDSLEIAILSNLFPYYVRNRHREPGEGYFEQLRPAHISLLHDDAHPSRMTLSVEKPAEDAAEAESSVIP